MARCWRSEYPSRCSRAYPASTKREWGLGMRKAMTFLALFIPIALTQSQPCDVLDIYFIDVEGGQATLFDSPSGESLLMDAGNPCGRDAGRIVIAAKEAGIQQIDYLIISHYHGDYFGGVAEVARQAG